VAEVDLTAYDRVFLAKVQEMIHTHFVAPMQERLAAEAERISRLERRVEAEELTARLIAATNRCYDRFPIGAWVRHLHKPLEGIVIPRPHHRDAEGARGRLIWCLMYDDHPLTPDVVVRGCYPWNLTTTPSGVDRG
jgi:hypothetical protein